MPLDGWLLPAKDAQRASVCFWMQTKLEVPKSSDNTLSSLQELPTGMEAHLAPAMTSLIHEFICFLPCLGCFLRSPLKCAPCTWLLSWLCFPGDGTCKGTGAGMQATHAGKLPAEAEKPDTQAGHSHAEDWISFPLLRSYGGNQLQSRLEMGQLS